LQKTRIDSAFYFFGGLADMFLTVMMWFIFRENKKSMMVTDGDWVYPVQSDMIVGVESAINIYEDDADEQV
jgi:hypothetical protein